MHTIKTDLVIVGGGSAGFGAAHSALEFGRDKIKIVLIEKNSGLGGTSTFGGVNCWEPGVGGPGIHYEMAHRLLQNPMEANVARVITKPDNNHPWAFLKAVEEPYENTLRRSALQREKWRRFRFEADALSKTMYELLSCHNNIDIMLNTQYISAELYRGRIAYIYVRDKFSGENYKIFSRMFVDASADIAMARDCGCKYTMGEDAAGTYNEPSAPPEKSGAVNAVSLIFRASRVTNECIDPIPDNFKSIDVSSWFEQKVSNCKLYSQIGEYYNGDINVNMLPTMEGAEYFSIPEDEAIRVSKARAWRYWNWLQTEKGMSIYTFKGFFPMSGIREAYRLTGKYVLNENDVRGGLLKQNLREELIAFSDHALDTHGDNGGCRELDQPYGIPYRCLLQDEIENLIVACRGASFSHIAASSCRLSRTMTGIGEAAGAAAIIAIEENKLPAEISVQLLRSRLGMAVFEEKIVKEWDL
ncbi:MAG: hypothetical protein A2Y21_03450 [Clostridiales bacterium GWC2_40_7]|nr:MAG: hypothetical protein A2Y21_03450 [Clostridiales bacterium GWC2_40_7]